MDSYGHYSSKDSAVLMRWDKMVTAVEYSAHGNDIHSYTTVWFMLLYAPSE
jgi:hypothetical protein